MITAEQRKQIIDYYTEKDMQKKEEHDAAYKEKAKEEDMVNSPSHYNYGDIECIDAIAAMLGPEGFIAYCKGSSLKYMWRAGLKFNSEEDLKKSVWYTRMSNGDDPRDRPNKALRDAAKKYSDAVESGKLIISE